MCIEANEVTQLASAAVALQTLPTTPDHSEGANNATLGNRPEFPNPIGETVLPARTITKIASKPSKSRKHVTFTASVISDVGTTPTGTVMFKHGAKILWAEEPLSHGIASITLKMVEVRGARQRNLQVGTNITLPPPAMRSCRSRSPTLLRP